MRSQILKVNENTEVRVAEDTQFVLDIPVSQNEVPYNVNLVFDKQGVSAEIIGLYHLNKGNKLNLTTIATHLVPNTSCNTKIRGVLDDNTQSRYTGKIIIKKSAQQTSSFLDDGVLVIGQNTKNRSDPILEIEADDVKASHGATTGRIDGSQVYYLQTRGLSEDEARDIIVNGYFESLLSEIVDADVRKEVRSRI